MTPLRQSGILLGIDLSYHVHRAVSVNQHLSSNGVFTGGIYGFFHSVAKAIRETAATDIVFCRDSKPYLRSASFPDYKLIRKKAQDPVKQQKVHDTMHLVTEALQSMGWPIWARPGFEADDLMAHASQKYRHRYKKIYLGSNDSDLFQMLWIPNLALYNNDIKTIHTGTRLMADQFLTPAQYMRMTAITGTHNDLPGVDGYGPIKALKAMGDPVQHRQLMEAHGDIIRRNMDLIKLPHAQLPKNTVMPMPTTSFHYRSLYKCLGRYDITVTEAMINSFSQVRTKCHST